jgi:sugar lactone lactonase YvrE
MLTSEPFVPPFHANGDRVKLGEGPISFRGRLATTDAARGILRLTDLTSALTEEISFPELLASQGFIKTGDPQILGCVAETEDGRVLAALSAGIFFFDPDTQKLSLLAHPEADRPDGRYNDGKVGPDGAFYVGGMTGREGEGRFWRVSANGKYVQPLKGAPPLTTPNGLHWSPTADPDVWDFYYVCSHYPGIQRYRHTLSSNIVERQKDLISLPQEKFGYLDGMAGSSNGLLFLCLYQGYCGCIVADSASGSIIEEISTGAPQTTSAAIIDGALYITSAAQEYTASDFEKYPNAGAVFRCDLAGSSVAEVREAMAKPAFKFMTATH